MNSRQVIILWIIAVALAVAVALVKVSQQASRDTATNRSPGDTLLASFSPEQVANISLTDSKGTLTLKLNDGTWAVAERDDYPARSSNVLSLLRSLNDLKVIQAMEAGPSFAPRFGMDEAARTAENRGVTAAFNDASGKEIARISAGRMLDSGGRFVRNHGDESGFYTVNDMLSLFDTDAVRWLDESFIAPENISSIKVGDDGEGGTVHWHVVRDQDDQDFRLADAAPGETLDSSAADSFKRLLGFARFQDVIPEEKVAANTADSATPRVATIETFEGFTYTLTITPAKAIEADPDDENAMPPAPDDHLLTIDVKATLPTERKKAETETEEVAAELEKSFQDRLNTLTEKLAKESALAGRTFRVTKSVVEQLLKARDEITAEAPAAETPATETPATETPATQAPAANSRPRTAVTTPPIEIPIDPGPAEN